LGFGGVLELTWKATRATQKKFGGWVEKGSKGVTRCRLKGGTFTKKGGNCTGQNGSNQPKSPKKNLKSGTGKPKKHKLTT